MRMMSPAWRAKYHKLGQQMFARLSAFKDSPQWDEMLDKEVSGFIGTALTDISEQMLAEGRRVAPGAQTMTKSILVDQMKATGDCDIGAFLKDWMDARACRISAADLEETDARIILTRGLSPAGEQ